MESRAKILGHPIHQVLVNFPIGMFGFTAVCDVLHGLTGRRTWADAARHAVGAGVVAASLAAPFGLLDYAAIPENTRAKSVGARHGLGNVAVLCLYAASWLARRKGASRAGVSLSTVGLALAGVTAWLGGELVNRLGIGVYEPTSFDAPSSIRQQRPVEIRAPFS